MLFLYQRKLKKHIIGYKERMKMGKKFLIKNEEVNFYGDKIF